MAKRGRKPGVPVGPSYGSVNWYLDQLEVGESHWFDAEFGTYPSRRNTIGTALQRPPIDMKDKEFHMETFTAVSASNCTRVCHLIRVERTA